VKQQADFAPGNTADFEWPASAEWREVRVELPVQGRLIHLRINPGRDVRGLAIRSIELRDASGERRAWRFDGTRL
jgi:hypothetical protein